MGRTLRNPSNMEKEKLHIYPIFQHFYLDCWSSLQSNINSLKNSRIFGTAEQKLYL